MKLYISLLCAKRRDHFFFFLQSQVKFIFLKLILIPYLLICISKLIIFLEQVWIYSTKWAKRGLRPNSMRVELPFRINKLNNFTGFDINCFSSTCILKKLNFSSLANPVLSIRVMRARTDTPCGPFLQTDIKPTIFLEYEHCRRLCQALLPV